MPLRETLEELRWRRDAVGCIGPVAASAWAMDESAALDMDVVEATDAEWARRAESSRVRRLTTASCSFSSSRCISAAVMGRGCLMGTPADSTLVCTYPLAPGLRGGNACPCSDADCAGGTMVPPGEAKGSGGGLMGYICEVRLETDVDVWRDMGPEAGCVLDGLLVGVGRGDAGTEFRSGAIVVMRLL